MNAVKTVCVWMLVGALLGVVGASLIVPPVLAWYNETGSVTSGKSIETLCNLPDVIRNTSTKLIRWQAIGAGVGALLFLFPGTMTVRRRREAPAPATPPAVT
jgi:hypothetical protein